MTKTEGVLREDHFLFTSNDIKHDILFAKLCNDMIHTYYDKVSVDIDLDIEFNDGCASQPKYICAIQCFASRKMRRIRVYFETSYDRSKSDGLGGPVKRYGRNVAEKVASENVLLCNAKEFDEIYTEKLEVTNSEEGKMLNRLFFGVFYRDLHLF